jgi:hypothetical protein
MAAASGERAFDQAPDDVLGVYRVPLGLVTKLRR